jgi:type II secretory ATPase GspE/PulE/Tfp pilus assembly ATPase PilB-like protein
VIPPADALAVGIPAHLLRSDGAFEAFVAGGCPACAGTGYRGRFAVCEFMEVTEPISHLVLQRAPSQQLARVADEEGMLGMREAGMARVADGTTSLEELLRALG